MMMNDWQIFCMHICGLCVLRQSKSYAMALSVCSMNRKMASTLEKHRSRLDGQFAIHYTAYDVHEKLECHQTKLFCQL